MVINRRMRYLILHKENTTSIKSNTRNIKKLMLSLQGSTGKPKTILASAAALSNTGVRREQRWNITAESRFACTAMTEEEGGFVEELCGGFYTGYNFVALPDCSKTMDPEILCREYLEALSHHRFVFRQYQFMEKSA